MGTRPPEELEACREIGRRVRAARKEAGLTQESLGHKAILDRTFVGHVERGETNPTALTLIRLATALEIDPGTLLADVRLSGDQPTRPTPTRSLRKIEAYRTGLPVSDASTIFPSPT